MKKYLISRYISDTRFSKYTNLDEYEENLRFSKKSYVPLSVLEVALRNSIDNLLVQKVGERWHEDQIFLTRDSQFKIHQAKDMLQKRRESTSRQKIIAELSFGFWVNLFKKPYDKKLRIKDLKNVFPNLPSKQVKFVNRELIYRELNHIRNFRNRIFHYEKVINKDNYNTVMSEIDEVLNYFDRELSTFAKKVNHE